MREHARFIGSFLRHPQAVGAIAPSSRHLAREMVGHLDASVPATIVELGPGTGSFTRAIEEKLHRDSLFLALELNESFAANLAPRFPRATIIHDSAEHIGKHLRAHDREHADAILCGLPWAGFPVDLQNRIMTSVIDALRPGGVFTTFAYIHAAWLPPARKFRRWLESHFPSVTTSRIVWRNLPPAFVYRCTK